MTTTNIIKSMGASDIDTKELTTNLVAAIKVPRQKLIDAEKKKSEVAISSAALLKNGLASLQAAATEIARLLRLYQIGAMVLIDFVSMESKAQRTQIAEAFDAAAHARKAADVSAVRLALEALRLGVGCHAVT
jgi:Ribonuclease G/E